MSEYSPQENEVTLPSLNFAGTLGDDDLLYLVQGTGEDRDRKLKLLALKQYMGTMGDISCGNINASGNIKTGSANSTIIKDNTVTIYDEGKSSSYSYDGVNLSAYDQGAKSASLTRDGLKIGTGTLNFNYTASIFTLDKPLSITGSLTASDSLIAAGGNFSASSACVSITNPTISGTGNISHTGSLSTTGNATITGTLNVGSGKLNVQSDKISSSIPYETSSLYASQNLKCDGTTQLAGTSYINNLSFSGSKVYYPYTYDVNVTADTDSFEYEQSLNSGSIVFIKGLFASTSQFMPKFVIKSIPAVGSKISLYFIPTYTGGKPHTAYADKTIDIYASDGSSFILRVRPWTKISLVKINTGWQFDATGV